ncbi:MAG: hypothetical protein ABIR94_22460 [Rubrivivax sp.]
MKNSTAAAALVLLGAVCGSAHAKLPPPSDEAKAAAAERAAKAAYATKVGAYQLCQVQNKVAARYLAGAGKAVQPAATPACTEPGPYAYTPEAAKPIEAAGAHSPAATATSPPSTTTPQAAQTPAK